MALKYTTQRVISDFVYTWRLPVNSFTDVSCTMGVYWENALWAAQQFLLQYRKWPLEKIGSKAEKWSLI